MDGQEAKARGLVDQARQAGSGGGPPRGSPGWAAITGLRRACRCPCVFSCCNTGARAVSGRTRVGAQWLSQLRRDALEMLAGTTPITCMRIASARRSHREAFCCSLPGVQGYPEHRYDDKGLGNGRKWLAIVCLPVWLAACGSAPPASVVKAPPADPVTGEPGQMEFALSGGRYHCDAGQSVDVFQHRRPQPHQRWLAWRICPRAQPSASGLPRYESASSEIGGSICRGRACCSTTARASRWRVTANRPDPAWRYLETPARAAVLRRVRRASSRETFPADR